MMSAQLKRFARLGTLQRWPIAQYLLVRCNPLGVTFWFDDNQGLPCSGFDWGSPVDINARTDDADSASEGLA